MKPKAVVFASLLALGACASAGEDTAGVVWAYPGGIVISLADLGVDGNSMRMSAAGARAATHCATMGQTAVLVPWAAGPGMPATVSYQCQ